jgi:long-chain fatty acid transport protein
MSALSRGSLLGSVAVCALVAAAGSALAGGFAVREQSAIHQGASFAGNAAGATLSSMFWNPAALGLMGSGLNSESGYAAIFTSSEFTPLAGTTLLPFSPSPAGTDTGRATIVPSSYGGYRLSPDFAIGVSLNAPFGLGSEPDNDAWAGRIHGRSAKLTTYNLTPTAAYRLGPSFFIGAGVQLEYAKLSFKFADAGPPASPFAPNAGLDIEDTLGVGFTAGLLWVPAPGTAIGLGFRSSITHEFEGNVFDNGNAFNSVDVEASLETPETVTLSLRQAIQPNMRLLATVEWSNWSRFDQIPIVRTNTGTGIYTGAVGSNFAVLDANWHDGWFYALGLEYDHGPGLTLRTGIAFEQSPVQNPSERLPQVPDSDRVWLSGGLSYQLFQNTTVDFAYTHIFVEDAQVDRLSLIGGVRLVADREASVDIVTFGYRVKW